jgi:APA family basic amino acid/polyamine antiporter
VDASRPYPEADPHVEQPDKLERRIGPGMLLLFILGDILGAGIYVRIGGVAGEVGGAIWLSFLLAFVVAALTAASYAELVTKYPGAGGAALYVNKAFQAPFVTFMVGFAVLASGLASASAVARAFGGDYLKAFVELPTVLVALAFILAVAFINFRGISESIRVNVVLTLIEAGGLFLVVLIGVAALSGGEGDLGRPFTFKEGASIPLAVLLGSSVAFYALIGFEDSVNLAEETREPNRIFPWALFGGLIAAGILYILVGFVAALVVNPSTLAGSSGPLREVVDVGPLAVPGQFFSAIALVAVTNTALINMIMASRILYGMANQRVVPEALGRVHRTRRTPWASIIFTTLIALVLVSTGDIGDLAQTTVLLLLLVFAIVNISVLILRRDRVDHRHFTVPAVIPVLGAITCLAVLSQQAGDIFVRAGLLLLVGLVLWVVNVLLRNRLDRQ